MGRLTVPQFIARVAEADDPVEFRTGLFALGQSFDVQDLDNYDESEV